jgi:GNAT superfamily N-acetyltransferase
MIVREINATELNELLELYIHLHETGVPEDSETLKDTWETIINDKNHHIVVAEENGKLVSSVVCVIIPNLTRNVRPYAFIENVVTHSDYRKQGYATACLNYARDIAKKENCYKMMLLTGSKDESTLNFYQQAGYNSADKTAFIQWL